MTSRMQQRRDTAANWTSNNPILAAGEIGFESDTSKMKIGNGSSAWSSLSYVSSGGTVTSVTGGTGLTGGAITSSGTLAIDSTVVATLTGSQTLSSKTLSSPTITGTITANSGTGTNGQFLQSTGTGVTWASVSGYSAPTLGSTSIASGSTVTTIAGLTLNNGSLSGTLTANSSTGTNGQYLQSTGTGVQWATVAASSDPLPQVFMLMGA